MDRFVAYGDVREIISKGETRATVKLRGGLQVDLRAVEPDAYGAALLYFTGSKAHNIDLRKIAQEKSYKLNEYGLFKGTRRAAGKTEEEVYAKLGLDWIPPELREARGEIALAREHRLPHLVEVKDIRGDLQMHTSATDGKGTIEDMAHAARALGYEYIAITDHSKRVTMALGLDTKRLREQWRAIDELNAHSRGGGVPLLKSGEVATPRGREAARRPVRALDRQPPAGKPAVHEVRRVPGETRWTRSRGYCEYPSPGGVPGGTQEGGNGRQKAAMRCRIALPPPAAFAAYSRP